MMRLGIDFDNTIVSYDHVFFKVALEKQLVPGDLACTKLAVRTHLRETGREADWTALQGEVYGRWMDSARPFAGVLAFMKCCRKQGVALSVVSHKTRFPYAGTPYDLHRPAQQWILKQGIVSAETGIRDDDVYLEPTKAAKIGRIHELGCACFIDDLPEFLSSPDFPDHVVTVLFDPADVHAGAPVSLRFSDWSEITPDMLASLTR